MCVQLILKLSVFSLFCVFLREENVLQVTSVSRFAAGPEHVTDRIGGFYLYYLTIATKNYSSIALILRILLEV